MKSIQRAAWKRFSKAFIWGKTYPLLFNGLHMHEIDEARALSRILVKAIRNYGIAIEVVSDLTEETRILPDGTEFVPDGIAYKTLRKIKLVRLDNFGLLVHEFAHILDPRQSCDNQKDIAMSELRASLVEYIVICGWFGLSSPNGHVEYVKKKGANRKTLLLCSKREVFELCNKINSLILHDL